MFYMESDDNSNVDKFEHVKEVAQELYAAWENFSYGIPKKGKIENVPSAEYYDKHYRFLTPEEFEKYGGGICWDYVEWGDQFLQDKDVKVRKFYIWTETPPNWDTHTFIVLDCGEMNRYVYVESSFKLLKGVWIHNSLDEIIDTITWNMFKCNDNARRFDQFRYVVFEFTGKHPDYGCTCKQYMNWMAENAKVIKEGYAKKDQPPNGVVQEAKITTKDRNELEDSDFGLVYTDEDGKKIRKYPLIDEEHVRKAVQFFNKAPDEYKEELARNIVKRAKELDMDWENWESLKPYLPKTTQESTSDNQLIKLENYPFDKVYVGSPIDLHEIYLEDELVQEAVSKTLKAIKKHQNDVNKASVKADMSYIKNFARKCVSGGSSHRNSKVITVKKHACQNEKDLFAFNYLMELYEKIGNRHYFNQFFKLFGFDGSRVEIRTRHYGPGGLSLAIYVISNGEIIAPSPGLFFIHTTNVPNIPVLKPNGTNGGTREYAGPCVFFFAIKSDNIRNAVKKLSDFRKKYGKYAYQYIPKKSDRFFVDSLHTSDIKSFGTIDDITAVFIQVPKGTGLPVRNVSNFFMEDNAFNAAKRTYIHNIKKLEQLKSTRELDIKTRSSRYQKKISDLERLLNEEPYNYDYYTPKINVLKHKLESIEQTVDDNIKELEQSIIDAEQKYGFTKSIVESYAYSDDEMQRLVQENFSSNGLTNANLIASRIHEQYKKDSKPPTGNQNCQVCTWCAEENFRGGTASPRPVYSPRDTVFNVNGWDIVMKPNKTPIKNKDDVIKKITLSGEGSRWYTHVKWKDGHGGHEFLLLNLDGNVYVMDAQQGFVESITSSEGSKYFDDITYKESFICRLDNKEFNHELFKKNNDPSKILPWDEKLDIPYMKKEGLISEEDDIQDLQMESYQMEGAWQDIKNGVNPWSDKLYFHVSRDDNLDGKTLKPRVPSYLTQQEEFDRDKDPYFEESKTPRVCFSNSIEGCLNAMISAGDRVATGGDELYVYVPVKPITSYKTKLNKELVKDKDVFDAKSTGEIWVLEPVQLRLYGTIMIDQVSNHKLVNTVNKAGKVSRITYKWHWQVKPKVIKKMDVDIGYFSTDYHKNKQSNDKPVVREGYSIPESYKRIQSFLEGNYDAFNE